MLHVCESKGGRLFLDVIMCTFQLFSFPMEEWDRGKRELKGKGHWERDQEKECGSKRPG